MVKKASSQSKQKSEPKPKRKKKAANLKNSNLSSYKKLPNVLELVKTSSQTLWRFRYLLVGISLVYGLLNLILVQGLSNSSDIAGLKNQLNQTIHGHFSSLLSGLSVFVLLVGSAGNGSSQTAGSYQLFLAIIASLAVIWALRNLLAGHDIKLKDAYYKGMYPFIPFILILLVIAIELSPLIIGATIYGTVISSDIAIGLVERILFLVIFILFASLTFYWLSSSVFALYIVTLPDMTPIKALKSAKQLVKGRRFIVFRKLIALPIILIIVAAIIMLPIIIWLTVLSKWIFFLLTMLALIAVHTYLYTLYREMLE